MLCRAGSSHRHSLTSPILRQARWPFKFAPPFRTKYEWSSLKARSRLEKNPKSLLSKFSLETSNFLVAIEKMVSLDLKRKEVLRRLKTTPSKILENRKTVYAFALELALNHCSERVVHILRISHLIGIVLAHNQYEQVVYQLATHKHWNHACQVATLAREFTGRWTTRLLNWLILSHVETQQYALLPNVLNIFEQEGLTPTRRTFHLLVRGHLQNSDLISARSCLMSMRDAGIEMDESTYLTVLGAYRNLGPNKVVEEQAFQTLQGSEDDPADTVILNGLMQLRMDDGDATGVLRVLKVFGLSLLGRGDDATYDGFGAASAAPSRVTRKVLPDSTTYNILMAFFAKRKDGLPNVLHMLGQLSALGLSVDVEAVAALIRAHFNAGMTSAAVAIVAEMCRAHNLAVDPYEFRLFGYTGGSLGPNILGALSVHPTTRIFNTMLQGVLPEHGFEGLRSVLRIMMKAGVTIDAATTQIIISYLHNVQHMRPRSLIRILQYFATLPTDQASLTIHHANEILRCLLRRERDIVRSKSWSATSLRVRYGQRPSFSVDKISDEAAAFDPTAGIALTSFKRSVENLFNPIIQSLRNRKVMSNSMTFALSIRRNATMKMDLDSARRVFDVMFARGIHPNAYHFSALMEGHAAQGDMTGAKEIMNRAARSGIPPNVVMYTILIIGYGRLRRPDLAMRTFNDMRSAGVEPDFAAIDAVVSTYFFVREYRTARNVLLDLWGLMAPFPQELVNASLHDLILTFRALRPEPSPLQPNDKRQYRDQRLNALREMDRIMAEIETYHSVSWAKQYVKLNPMSHVDVPEEEVDLY